MRREKGVEMALIIAFFLLAAIPSHASSAEEDPKDMVWRLLDEMAKRMPLNEKLFGEIIGMEPWLDKQGESKTSWRVDPINLSEVLGIHDASISLGKDGSFYAAGFDVAGACIHVRDVRKKYGTLEIVDTPKGHSLFDDTIYQSQQDWGSFYFTFLDIAPDCLSSVTVSSRRDIGI